MAKYHFNSQKDPRDSIPAYFDWTATPFASGETITTANVSVTAASGTSTDPTTLTTTGNLIAGPVVWTILTNGINGTKYTVNFYITTSAGRAFSRSGLLTVKTL